MHSATISALQPSRSSTRLQGNWLIAARIGWGFIAAMSLLIFIYALIAAAQAGYDGIRLERDPLSHETVIEVMPESPAEAAGLRTGDALLAVNGVQVVPAMPLEDVNRLLSGTVGEEDSLTVHTGLRQVKFNVTHIAPNEHVGHPTTRLLISLGAAQGFAVVYPLLIEGLVMLGFTLVAAIIFVRQPSDWIALFTSAALLMMGATIGDSFNAMMGTRAPSAQASLGLELFASLANVFSILFFFVFPDGRVAPRALITIPILAGWAVWSFGVNLDLIAGTGTTWGRFLDLGFYVAALFAQIYRYFKVSSQEQKQQTKWVVMGLIVAVLIFFTHALPLVLVEGLQEPQAEAMYELIAGSAASVSLLLVPLTIGIAILHYRLWEIDFIISRGIVYGSLTLLLVGLLIGSLALIEAIFTAMAGTGQSAIALGATSLVFGGLFQPTRRWLRAHVDQRLYGIKVDYQKRDPTLDKRPDDTTQTSLGTYRNMELIQRGGMAEVYRAMHPTLNRTVAIKMLRSSLVDKGSYRRRFEREAKTVASLRHPNIVQVFDYGDIGETYYMVMEYIEGPNLAELLADQGALSLPEARRLIGEIAGALDYAHEMGLVHRDVKPSNVMLQPISGASMMRAILTDFGVARLTTAGSITGTGVVGTFDYIAPEQIRDSKEVDRRADVYALGVMAYQMTTGKLPFRGYNTAAVLIAHLNKPAPNPCNDNYDLPDAIGNAVVKAMQKEPDQRWESAGAFAAALL